MKRLIIICISILIYTHLLVGQQLYQRAYTGIQSVQTVDVSWSAIDQSYVLATSDLNSWVALSKTDATGYPLWRRVFTFPSFGVTVDVAASGAIYVTGVSDSSSTNGITYFILCTDPMGSMQWMKEYHTSAIVMYNYPSLKILNDGSLLLIESIYGQMAYIHTDANGNILETHAYQEDTTAQHKIPSLDGDGYPDGSYIFVGKRDNDITAVRTDSNGTITWSKAWNTSPSYYHLATTVMALDDGSAIIAGQKLNWPFLMRIDSVGNVLWYGAYQVGAPSMYEDVAAINDSTFLASSFLYDASMITKFDIHGNILGCIYFWDTDLYVDSKYIEVNPAGQIAWPFLYVEEISFTHGIAFNLMDDLTTTGCHLDTIYMPPADSGMLGPLPLTMYQVPNMISVTPISVSPVLAGQGYTDMCWIVGAQEVEEPSQSLIMRHSYSLSEEISFHVENYTGPVQYTIRDITGKTVSSSSEWCYNGSEVRVNDSPYLPSGIYTISVQCDEKYFAAKFIMN